MLFTAIITGGEGPDVWDREVTLSGVDMADALSQATGRATDQGGVVVMLLQVTDDYVQPPNRAVEACEQIMEAIAGHTEWHPSPDVDQSNWNEDAHVNVTLTVKDCRLIKRALMAAGKLDRFTQPAS